MFHEKEDLIMKQDILIFSSRITHSEQVCAAMDKHDISALVVFNAYDAMATLVLHPPAFFWLDIDIEDARLFLKEITDKVLHPPPYIILTSFFTNSAHRAIMLGQGADTCIEMPADLNEILAVLNAVMRREERLNGWYTGKLLPCIEHKELFIDPLRRRVRMRGQVVDLTRKEYDVLYLLASHPGTAINREQIYSHIWKAERNIDTSIVTDCISSLRQKLGLHPKDIDYIQTVFRVGYRFAESG